jgi:hypothetical protein
MTGVEAGPQNCSAVVVRVPDAEECFGETVPAAVFECYRDERPDLRGNIYRPRFAGRWNLELAVSRVRKNGATFRAFIFRHPAPLSKRRSALRNSIRAFPAQQDSNGITQNDRAS